MDIKSRIYTIIFGTDTPAGKLFDIGLVISILLSIVVVIMDSVASIRLGHDYILTSLEWGFTILFTIEYGLRLYSSPKKKTYVRSFYGLIDLASIVPTYLSYFLPSTQYLMVIRVLRVLRIFRILKLAAFLREVTFLIDSMRASARKILVFLFSVVTLCVILGSVMYMIEGEAHGFTSIPRGIYWAVVTLTTVGYGDISPGTPLGQLVAGIVMILGYGIIAVPAGLVTSEMVQLSNSSTGRKCPSCQKGKHDREAVFCKWCGETL